MSISTGFNWSLNLLVAFTFPYLQEVTTRHSRIQTELQGLGFGAYYLFAGMAVLAIAWFWLVLVESKVLVANTPTDPHLGRAGPWRRCPLSSPGHCGG